MRSKVFDYSGKKIISIKEFDQRANDEIKRVKSLKTSTINSPWITNQRDKKSADPRIWEEDNLIRIPKVGPGLVKKLKLCNVNKVKDLMNLPESTKADLISKGIPKTSLESAVDKCATAIPGECEIQTIDHRQSDNPYKSKFPNDHADRIKKASALRPFVCITDLVDWIVKESKRLMQTTIHEND